MLLVAIFVLFQIVINQGTRIVNGIPISANEYPWMVSLRRRYTIPSYGIFEDQFCGGSLINLYPPIVLTAAHCIDSYYYNKADDKIYDQNDYEHLLWAGI